MQVRNLILTASAFVIASAGPAHAQDWAPVASDSGLQALVAEALARNPTVAQRRAAVRAATLRIRPAGSLPDPMLTVGVMDLPLPPSDSLVALALAAHPRLAARRAAVDQATRTIQVERLGARPDFTLSARYGYRPVAFGFNFPDFFSAFVGLRLPVWAWRKQNRLADAARADSTGAAAGLRDAELQLSREVTEAAARVQASQQRLALLVDGVLPNARGTVESVLRSYQVGRAEFLTLLSVEDARYRAELEAVAVAADYQAQLVMLRQLTAGETQP